MVLYEHRLMDDMNRIRELLQDISNRVCAALESTITAIANNDRDAMNRVVVGDYGINRDIRKLDARCHAFVAQHLPAAGHLRFISAVLRITIALERSGDYAVTICRVALQLPNPLPAGLVKRLEPMAAISLKMLEGATRAFLNRNVQEASEIKKLDFKVDKEYDDVFAELMADETPLTPLELVALLKIFNKVERFSDQAKNICEEAVFAATGIMKTPKIFRVLFLDEKNDFVGLLAAAIAKKGYSDGGVFSSAGYAPSLEVDERLEAMALRFGLDVSAAKPSRVGVLDIFPTPYHVVVGINLRSESVIPKLPYHTSLLKWQLEIPEYLPDLVRNLGNHIAGLMETLRGKTEN